MHTTNMLVFKFYALFRWRACEQVQQDVQKDNAVSHTDLRWLSYERTIHDPLIPAVYVCLPCMVNSRLMTCTHAGVERSQWRETRRRH